MEGRRKGRGERGDETRRLRSAIKEEKKRKRKEESNARQCRSSSFASFTLSRQIRRRRINNSISNSIVIPPFVKGGRQKQFSHAPRVIIDTQVSIASRVAENGDSETNENPPVSVLGATRIRAVEPMARKWPLNGPRNLKFALVSTILGAFSGRDSHSRARRRRSFLRFEVLKTVQRRAERQRQRGRRYPLALGYLRHVPEVKIPLVLNGSGAAGGKRL